MVCLNKPLSLSGPIQQTTNLSYIRANDFGTLGAGTDFIFFSFPLRELSEARDITEFPDLTGTTRLTRIILDRASISALPANLCENMADLKIL